MRTRHTIILTGAAAVLLLPWTILSTTQLCFARELMTRDEWRQHQATMWSLPPIEREAYRAKHREATAKRAAAMGLSFPNYPPPMGMGRGRAVGPSVWVPGYGPRWYPYGGWGRPSGGRGPGGRWYRG